VGRTVSIKLLADVAGYMTGMQRAATATKEFSGELNKTASGGKAEQITRATAAIGVGMLGVAGAAVKMSMDFDKSMSAVKAATNDSSKSVADNTKNMNDLRAAALQAGKDTSFSATEAANGITELAKAGVKTADILHGGLKGALDLAAAGQISVADASETAASAMTQFKLSGSAVPHIADLLAAGAGKAQGSVRDMGMALGQSGLVASQFGLSIEDTTGTLAAFAHAGLIGSDAGTSFKTMLLALANPAAKTKETMDELGISAYDAQGNFVGITKLAEQLKTKLGGLTQAQRDAALAQIFGTDAIRAANVLYQEGGKGIQGWIGSVNDAGYASKTAATMTDNLAGDLERLKGSLETLAIESGSGANSGLRILVKTLDELVGAFADMPPAVGGTVVVLSGIGGVILLALTGFLKLRTSIARTVEQLNAMGPAGERAAGGISRLAGFAGKASLVLAGLEIVGEIAKQFDTASVNADRLTKSLGQLADTGKVTGELSDVFGDNLKDLGKNAQAADAASHGFWGALNDIADTVPGVGNMVQTLNDHIYGLSFDKAKENMQGLDQALTDFMTTSGDAVKASELWNRILSESGLDTQQLAKLLPNAYTEVGKLNQAQDDASRAGAKMGASGKVAADGTKAAGDAAGQAATDTKKYTDAATAAAGAARGQRDALKSLSDFMKAETDPIFGFIKAEDDLTAAHKNYSKAVKEHGAKSKEAKAADRELAAAAIVLQGAVGDVSSSFNGKLSPALVDTLKKAGLTKSEIKNLEGQFKDAKKAADQYDGKYEAKTSAPGAAQAKKDLDLAYSAANHFAGPYSANLKVTNQTKVEAELRKLSAMQQALKSANTLSHFNGDGPGFAGGGWTGPGAKYQPAGVVHADEFVVNKSARAPLENARPGGLDYMNRTGQWPGYAAGGMVWPYPVNASKTKVPSPSFSAPGGGGGPGYKWMEAVVRTAFPGMPIYSDYRPGARTLTGNRSYHGFGRAVDFAPSRPLAEWINLHFMRATKELITPWQSLNIHNGSRHHYSALIENQHNFAGGNAHDHWAMRNGGVISEPIFGVGASGRTYSFGENYQAERVTPMWQNATGGGGNVTVILENRGVIGSRMELETWLAGSIDDLKRKGKI
jgi:TP901 family phage tail tape measure protein